MVEPTDEPPLQRPEILLALHRKLSKKIESGRGIMLSADELNVFVAVGAFATLATAATEYQVKKCRERNARSRSINDAPSASNEARAGQSSKLSGPISIDAADEALAQARAICGRHS